MGCTAMEKHLSIIQHRNIFCFVSADKIPYKGVWPDPKEVLGELAYLQPILADVTRGLTWKKEPVKDKESEQVWNCLFQL